MEIHPALPNGLLLSNEGILSGMTQIPLNKTMFSIIANGDQTLTTTLQITIMECSFGPITVIGATTSARLSLIKDGVVVLNETSITAENGYCLEQGSYDYFVTALFDYVGMYIRSADGFIYSRFDYPNYQGTFQIGSTSAPMIHLPSFIPVQEAGIRLPFQIEGGFTQFQLHPSTGIDYDPVTNVLTFQLTETGLFMYELTVSNAIGASTHSFTVGVNQCLEGREKMIIDTYYNFFSSFNFYDESGLLQIHRYKNVRTPYFICAQFDTLYPFILNESHMGDESFYLYLMDQDGVLSEYPLNDVTRASVVLHSVTQPGSEMRFVKNLQDGWMQRQFDDSLWQQAHSGNWGNWSDEKRTYFRYHFQLDDLHNSNLHIRLFTSHTFVVYLNEAKISVLHQVNKTQYRISVPYSFLEKNNLLAIELIRAGAEPTIEFDLQMFATQTPHLTLSTGGIVTTSQETPDPKHPPESVFANDMSYWSVPSLPVTIDYTFPGNQSKIVNAFYYGAREEENLISKMRIEGVEDGQSTVLLNITSKALETINYFDFDATGSFATYRIVIEEAQQTDELDLYYFRLLQKNPQICEKKYGIEGAKAGSVYLTACPGTEKVGKKQLKCVSENYQAVWREDESSCVSMYPPAETAYVDFLVVISAERVITEDFMKNDIPKSLMDLLRIDRNNIGYVYVYNRGTVEISSYEIAIRLTVDEDLGDHVGKVLRTKKQEYVEKIMKDHQVKMEFIEDPVVRKPKEIRMQPPGSLVNWMVMACLVVLVVFSLVVSQCTSKMEVDQQLV